MTMLVRPQSADPSKGGGDPYPSTHDLLAALPEGFRQQVLARVAELDEWIAAGLIPIEGFFEQVVLDWEGGNGAFAVAFLLRGARHVVVTDSWLSFDHIPNTLKHMSSLTFAKSSIHGFVEGGDFIKYRPINLVFANTVTEHLQDLPRDLRVVSHVLSKHRGYFFTNHDNYFQPVGSHDHGFLFYGPNNNITALGPKCWTDTAKCESSSGYRATLRRKYPWTWNEANEKSKDPLNCSRCHYYKRSQPWAHLLFQDEFSDVFCDPSFKTGVPGASLNKLTPFQLRQLIVEADLSVQKERRLMIENKPPDGLLYGTNQFTERDLRTTMVQILARPRSDRN